MPKPAVFITGATGLVGSHLARLLLLRGYDRITAIKRPGSNLDILGPAASQIRWVDGDVLDPGLLEEGMEGAEWVFHCAGLITYDPGLSGNLYAVNVEGTANVVNAALHTGVQKLLHVSSVSVLARTGPRQQVDESTPWQQTRYSSLYGHTKHLAEREVQRGIAEGLQASIVIPSIILGPGNWKDGSATIYYRLGRGMPFYPKGQNGFVDVRDVALLSLLVMEQPGSWRVMASGHTIGYKDLFQEICRRIGKTPPRIPVGPLASELLWRLFVPVRWLTGRQPVINKETARAAQCFPTYNHAHSLSVPGFRYTDLVKTLDDTAREYLIAKEKNFITRYLDFPETYLT